VKAPRCGGSNPSTLRRLRTLGRSRIEPRLHSLARLRKRICGFLLLATALVKGPTTNRTCLIHPVFLDFGLGARDEKLKPG